MDNNILAFIEEQKKRLTTESSQNGMVNPPVNVKQSLLALKNAVDGHGPLQGIPILESIKKVENVVDSKTQQIEYPQNDIHNENNSYPYDDKEDAFTKDLLRKTKQFISGNKDIVKPQMKENKIQEYNNNIKNPIQQIAKNEVLEALKDTITDLYVKEKVENIIKEFLVSQEGKKIIKSILIEMVKKK